MSPAQAHHELIYFAVAYWLYSAAVTTMPAPTLTSSTAYVWLFKFLHALAANLDKVMQARQICIPIPDDIKLPPKE